MRQRPLTTAFGVRLPDWLLDYGPVALIVLESAIALRVAAQHHGAGWHAVLALGIVATAVALSVRHRWPLMVLAVVLAVAFGFDFAPVVMLPVLLALFTVAEYTERPKVIVAAVVAATVLTIAQPVHGHAEALPAILSHLAAVGMAVAAGLYLRARADYVSGLRERAERLERERELLAHQAVADERVRIARDLHDVVAHNVSLMVVQAQALAATTDGNRATLKHIADLGRLAMGEMHTMLEVLRIQEGDPHTAEREPQPGVEELKTLVARTRETGLDVTLHTAGTPRELPPGIGLSIYRIVQEALTNVIRHARASSATVTVVYAPDTVDVTVTDDGTGATPGGGANGRPSGHGLIGMRERAALFGGSLEAGAREDAAGYCVKATLPAR